MAKTLKTEATTKAKAASEMDEKLAAIEKLLSAQADEIESLKVLKSESDQKIKTLSVNNEVLVTNHRVFSESELDKAELRIDEISEKKMVGAHGYLLWVKGGERGDFRMKNPISIRCNDEPEYIDSEDAMKDQVTKELGSVVVARSNNFAGHHLDDTRIIVTCPRV
jgi:calcineurin-like phosphoesterase family protein